MNYFSLNKKAIRARFNYWTVLPNEWITEWRLISTENGVSFF